MPSHDDSVDPRPLGALLGTAATRFGLDDALATGALWKTWGDIVGPDVAAHAQPTSLRGGVLRIRADSPVWAHEIAYLADEIKRRANTSLGRDVVAEVRVWTAPGDAAAAGGPRPDPGGHRREDARSDAAPSSREDDPLEALGKARDAWLSRRGRGPGSDPRERP